MTDTSPPGMVRVLVVDDQPLVRSGLVGMIDGTDGIQVVGEAGDGAEAVVRSREQRPDVVLMDIRMPVLDGIEATRRILGEASDTGPPRVVILTTFDLDEYVTAALAAGASGFVLKNAEAAEIVRAVRVVADGDAMLSPEVTRRVIEQATAPARRPTDQASAGLLTAREREVVDLVARGLSNTDIARSWVVSETTVRTHVSRAMTKLQARDRAHLVVLAYRLGLADVDT